MASHSTKSEYEEYVEKLIEEHNEYMVSGTPQTLEIMSDLNDEYIRYLENTLLVLKNINRKAYKEQIESAIENEYGFDEECMSHVGFILDVI